MAVENGPQLLSAQIEDLVRRVEAISDPAVKANTTVLIQSLLDLHGDGFGRIAKILSDEGESGRRILNKMAADELVGSLLLLYELHPDSFDVRLRKALDRAQQSISSHGAQVDLVDVQEGTVHVRLTGTLQGCGSTKATLRAVN